MVMPPVLCRISFPGDDSPAPLHPISFSSPQPEWLTKGIVVIEYKWIILSSHHSDGITISQPPGGTEWIIDCGDISGTSQFNPLLRYLFYFYPPLDTPFSGLTLNYKPTIYEVTDFKSWGEENCYHHHHDETVQMTTRRPDNKRATCSGREGGVALAAADPR